MVNKKHLRTQYPFPMSLRSVIKHMYFWPKLLHISTIPIALNIVGLKTDCVCLIFFHHAFSRPFHIRSFHILLTRIHQLCTERGIFPLTSHVVLSRSFWAIRECATGNLQGTQLSGGVLKLSSWPLKDIGMSGKTFKELIQYNGALNTTAATQHKHLEVTSYYVLLQYKII